MNVMKLEIVLTIILVLENLLDFYLLIYMMNITHDNESYQTNHDKILEMHSKLHWSVSSYEDRIYKAICEDPKLAQDIIAKLHTKVENKIRQSFLPPKRSK